MDTNFVNNTHKIALIGGDLSSVFNDLVDSPAFVLFSNGEQFNLETFQSKVQNLIKTNLIDICLFDPTVVEEDVLVEAIKYIKLNNPSTRIIVTSLDELPNNILASLVAISVYDIVVDEQSAMKQRILLAIDNPLSLANVAHYLDYFEASAHTVNENNENAEDNEEHSNTKKKTYSKKPFLYIYYKTNGFNRSVKALASKYYEIQDTERFDSEDPDKKLDLSKLRYLNVNNIIIENPNSTEIQTLAEVLDMLPTEIKALALFSNKEEYQASYAEANIPCRFYATKTELKRLILNFPTSIDDDSLGLNKTNRATKTIVVTGARGGCGTSTLASLIGKAAVQRGLKTCVVDFRLTPGDLCTFFNCTENEKNMFYFFSDCVNKLRQGFDPKILTHSLSSYIQYNAKENISLVDTPFVDFAEFSNGQISDEELDDCIEILLSGLKQQFDIVIYDVDLYSNLLDRLMLEAEKVYIVSDLSFGSVYRLKSSLHRFDSGLFPLLEESLSLIINKSDKLWNELEYENDHLIRTFFDKKIYTITYDESIKRNGYDLRKVKLNKNNAKVFNELLEAGLKV